MSSLLKALILILNNITFFQMEGYVLCKERNKGNRYDKIVLKSFDQQNKMTTLSTLKFKTFLILEYGGFKTVQTFSTHKNEIRNYKKRIIM